MLTLEDAWRNHAYGSKHRHFRYPNTWRGRVNPGRLGGARGLRSGFQCRGCGRPRAEHSRLRLTQFGVRGSACCRFGESATGRSDNCRQSRKACRIPGGYAARTDRVTSTGQASNSRCLSSPSSLAPCSSPSVAVLRFPALGAIGSRRTWLPTRSATTSPRRSLTIVFWGVLPYSP
jgi:hypothetical protein